MKLSWKTFLLWSLPILVIAFFAYQSFFARPALPQMSVNAANTRISYGRFLGYLDAHRVRKVDIYEGGRTAIIVATDPQLENREQRARVDLPAYAPELMAKLKEGGVDLAIYPPSNNSQIWGFLSNLIFPIALVAGLFFLFRRSSQMGGPGQAMDFGKSKIISCKNFKENDIIRGNPRGYTTQYKLVNGCKIIKSQQGWTSPADKEA
jgi:cell division protease FtsH